MKTYFVIGTRQLPGSVHGAGAFIAAVDLDAAKPLEPQLQDFLAKKRVVMDLGVIVCEAVLALGGPNGKGPE